MSPTAVMLEIVELALDLLVDAKEGPEGVGGVVGSALDRLNQRDYNNYLSPILTAESSAGGSCSHYRDLRMHRLLIVRDDLRRKLAQETA